MADFFFIQSKLNTAGSFSGVDLVIDIKGGSETEGTQLDVYKKKTSSPGWDNQLWKHDSVSGNPGFYFLQADMSKTRVIDIGVNALVSNAKKALDKADSQMWRFVPDPNEKDYYYILSLTGNLVIDVENAAKSLDLDVNKLIAGAHHQLWKWLDTNGNVKTPPVAKPTLTVTPGRGDFSFVGQLFVPGSKVKVSSGFDALGGTVAGGPWSYTVADDGSFADDISVDYFQASGELTVRAQTQDWGDLFTVSTSVTAGG